MSDEPIFSILTGKGGCTNTLPPDDRTPDDYDSTCYVYTWQDYGYSSYDACIQHVGISTFCCGAEPKRCSEADFIRANYPA